MTTQDCNNKTLIARKERVAAQNNTKSIAKEVARQVLPLVKEEVKRLVSEQVEEIMQEFKFNGITIVTAQELAERLGIAYSTVRKMDKSAWPQFHLMPGGVRYHLEGVLALLAK